MFYYHSGRIFKSIKYILTYIVSISCYYQKTDLNDDVTRKKFSLLGYVLSWHFFGKFEDCGAITRESLLIKKVYNTIE